MTRQRDGLSDGLPGAIVRATVDNTHPLGSHLGSQTTTIRSKPFRMHIEMPERADTFQFTWKRIIRVMGL
jgi:hypothetical protein